MIARRSASFRSTGAFFTDPKVFDAELRYIFEATWNFIGLESQVAQPNDFFTTYVGRHPILVTRSAKATLAHF